MEIKLQGSLNTFPFPEILVFFHETGKTGTLNLIRESQEVYIYFEEGSVVFATSNQERFHGEILLRRKKLDTEDAFRDSRKIQVSEIIYDCFGWEEGKFSFIDVFQPPEDAVLIHVDPFNLIMEGARRLDASKDFTRLLPRKTAVLRLIGEEKILRGLSLSLPEWRIVFLINGKRTLEQIIREADLPALQVNRTLYGLYASRLIETVPEDEVYMARLKEAQVETTEAPTAGLELRTLNLIRDTTLVVSSEANLSYNDVLKVTLARFTVKNAEPPDKIFPLIEQEYYVGRQMGNQIHISDPSISNVHARVFKGPEGYLLEDLNSRNGTFINGTRIDRRLLQDGDEMRLGNTLMTYNIVYEVKSVRDTG